MNHYIVISGSMDEWDVIAPVDVPQHKIANIIERNSLLGTITGTITSGVGKTVNSMQRAMGKLFLGVLVRYTKGDLGLLTPKP